ncbi:hypothetical protein DBR11_24055 [Pedobacter sp. HMWF019]|uniref:hypothetical protein n=1 Tax=Pedobacter sp. HMWF019 TaxID=2056856 RepID=UPI000D3C24C1|nr:hypothetical protein [Pedobacter sp. HMWF019]PTS94106.1 hypothetical protein DBR11_24055 [Pedobacter sp. HMWF019]
MNTLIIGTELPNYNNPVLTENSIIPDHELNLDEQLIITVQNLPVYNYIISREKLNLYYMEKFRMLKLLCARHLSELATVETQYPALAAVLRLNKPSVISEIIPYLKELNIYHNEVNWNLNQQLPVYGIRMGLGFPDLVTYASIFEKLSQYLKPKDHITKTIADHKMS